MTYTRIKVRLVHEPESAWLLLKSKWYYGQKHLQILLGTSWAFRKYMALDLLEHLWRHNALMKMTHFCPREKTWNLQNISSKAQTSQACLLKGFRNNYTIPFANCHVLYVTCRLRRNSYWLIRWYWWSRKGFILWNSFMPF